MIRALFILAALAAIGHAQPAPGTESGRADEIDPADSTARVVARGALFLPRVIYRVAFAPLEGVAWAFERFQLADRSAALFFTDDGMLGLVPTLSLESGFGVNAGARFVARDVFGAREHFVLGGSFGGRFHEKVATSFRSGDRWDALKLEATGAYERRPHDTFYGLGNTEMVAAAYRHRVARASASADERITGAFYLRAGGELADHQFGVADTGPAIDMVYPAAQLAGFSGSRTGYGELALRWDTRGRVHAWDPTSVYATGWLAAGFAGRATALDHGADFWRYGVDLQRFIYLADGPRVLAVRGHGEAVTGETSQVPFIELPRLGGGRSLRGYPVDRFRDRVAVSGSIEYQWDLSRFVGASVFVDAGKVAPAVRDLDFKDLRVGYGISVEAHTDTSFLARATLASSIDGGVFLDLALDPVFEVEGRTER